MKPQAATAITLLSKLQDRFDKTSLAYWVLPNTILSLSGARPYCDGVFWSDSDKQLKKWRAELQDHITFITEQGGVLWGETAVKEPRPAEKFAGYELLLEAGLHTALAHTGLLTTTTIAGLKDLPTAEAIIDSIIADLRQQPRLTDYSKEDLHHVAFGILLGYPDAAITESVKKWGVDDPFAEPFIDADIRGAGYYICPQPVYSYPRHLVHESSIVAHERQWSKILRDYYTSDFHQALQKDSAFQKKMQELGNLR